MIASFEVAIYMQPFPETAVPVFHQFCVPKNSSDEKLLIFVFNVFRSLTSVVFPLLGIDN